MKEKIKIFLQHNWFKISLLVIAIIGGILYFLNQSHNNQIYKKDFTFRDPPPPPITSLYTNETSVQRILQIR